MAASATTPMPIDEPPADVQAELQRLRSMGQPPHLPATPELIASLAKARADIKGGQGMDADEFFRLYPSNE